MRLVRYRLGNGSGWGFLEDDHVHPVASLPSLEEALEVGTDLTKLRRTTGDPVPLNGVRLLAPLTHPSKIIGVGLNYRDHAEESGMSVPEVPVLFAVFPSSIIGPDEAIQLPAVSRQVDWEAELAVVIGRRARRVSEGEALDHVLGYTAVNDVSARDLQVSDGQWVRAKSFDTFKPMGPCITTVDEMGEAGSVGVRSWVNGVVKQSSNTSFLVFGIRELVAFCSEAFTLEPGDLILTGTPAGVGMGRQPPEYLRDGDEVTVEVEGVGTIRNPVRGADASG